MITCDEIVNTAVVPTKITSTKTAPTKSDSTSFYILVAFLLITIAFMINIIIYLKKRQAKQKHYQIASQIENSK